MGKTEEEYIKYYRGECCSGYPNCIHKPSDNKQPKYGTHCHICHEAVDNCGCGKRFLNPNDWKGKLSPYRLFEISGGNADEYKRLMIENGYCKEIKDVDLNEETYADKFIKAKYESQEEAKKCTMKFGGEKEKFGTLAIPSVEDIEKEFWKEEEKYGFKPAYKTLAQAIHRFLLKGEK